MLYSVSMKHDDISQLLQKQESIYSFLQRIYEKELTEDFIAEIPAKIGRLRDISGMLSAADSKKAVDGLIEFGNSISSQDPDTLKTTLAADYARLFLSVNKVPPHPSESTYREGMMMQHYRDEVLEAYWSFQVSADKEFTEPEDHIATELSFMAFLCQKSRVAIENGDTKKAIEHVAAQKDFLEKHLLKWVPMLVKDILDTARTPFYKGIAALTTEFIEMSLSAADDILGQLK